MVQIPSGIELPEGFFWLKGDDNCLCLVYKGARVAVFYSPEELNPERIAQEIKEYLDTWM